MAKDKDKKESAPPSLFDNLELFADVAKDGGEPNSDKKVEKKASKEPDFNSAATSASDI